MINTARLDLVIPRKLKDKLKAAAEDKGISMSEFVKDALKQNLEWNHSQQN